MMLDRTTRRSTARLTLVPLPFALFRILELAQRNDHDFRPDTSHDFETKKRSMIPRLLIPAHVQKIRPCLLGIRGGPLQHQHPESRADLSRSDSFAPHHVMEARSRLRGSPRDDPWADETFCSNGFARYPNSAAQAFARPDSLATAPLQRPLAGITSECCALSVSMACICLRTREAGPEYPHLNACFAVSSGVSTRSLVHRERHGKHRDIRVVIIKRTVIGDVSPKRQNLCTTQIRLKPPICHHSQLYILLPIHCCRNATPFTVRYLESATSNTEAKLVRYNTPSYSRHLGKLGYTLCF
jgi:hypothetical protein